MKKIKDDFSNFRPEKKPRITASVDEMVQRRAYARGALEGLTRSETIEKALKEYGDPKNISYASGATISQLAQTFMPNAGAATIPIVKRKYSGGAATGNEI